MDRNILAALGFVLLPILATDAIAQSAAPSIEIEVDARGGEVVVGRFVPRRSPEWHQLKEMEEYYDDLEDFYKKRDPALAKYYERWEKYFENVRKGKPAYMPPELVIDGAPGAGPYFAPPGLAAQQPRISYRQPIQVGPHTNLERTYRVLQQQLSRLTTADSWLRYLALPFDAQQSSTSIESLMTEKSKAQFAEALQRFDQTASDPEYQMIARLPAFNRTRSSLRSFTQWLERQPPVEEPEEIIGEEIPLTPPAEPQPPAVPQPPAEPQPSGGPVLPPQ